MNTPLISNNGMSHDKSKVRICATRVVLTSAPIITANPAAVPIIFFDAKEEQIIAVAVELCKIAVTPSPATNAFNLLLVLLAMTCCSDVAKARVKPFLTMRVPQRRRATAPMILMSMSVIDASMTHLLRVNVLLFYNLLNFFCATKKIFTAKSKNIQEAVCCA